MQRRRGFRGLALFALNRLSHGLLMRLKPVPNNRIPENLRLSITATSHHWKHRRASFVAAHGVKRNSQHPPDRLKGWLRRWLRRCKHEPPKSCDQALASMKSRSASTASPTHTALTKPSPCLTQKGSHDGHQ